jgi:hypothetical protein
MLSPLRTPAFSFREIGNGLDRFLDTTDRARRPEGGGVEATEPTIVHGRAEWRERGPSNRAVENPRLVQEITAIHTESRRTYGSPRIHAELYDRSERTGRKRVARLMRAQADAWKGFAELEHTDPGSQYTRTWAPQRSIRAPYVITSPAAYALRAHSMDRNLQASNGTLME